MSAATVLYIPHGGGPLPLLEEPSHAKMNVFLRAFPAAIEKPDAIVVVSAHWEEPVVSVTSAPQPPLIFDYYGFPPQTYDYEYPAAGAPQLAAQILDLLGQAGIDARADATRGFDHGLFVPLLLMYPQADIPCVQLSLDASLDAARHIAIGKALRALQRQNLLILGSGFSFHNMQVLMSKRDDSADERNLEFDAWLEQTCCDAALDEGERELRLGDWEAAPHARYCHPREEHLLPLQVCYGVGGGAAERVFRDSVANVLAGAYRW